MFFPGITYRYKNWTIKKAEHWRTDALNCGAGEDSWESLEQQGGQSSQFSLHFRSVHFSHSVVSESLWTHGLQHASLPCPSPTPRAYSNSYPSQQWCHPTTSSSVIPFSSCSQSFPASGLFQWVISLHQMTKVLSFSFNISPSNEYSGLISFRMDWLDLLVIKGTPKSLLKLHSSKASILWHSAFFIVQLSHPYMTTGKPRALTRRTFVGKVMPLLFNMLSRLVTAFLSRRKLLSISLQSPSAEIWSLRK